MGWYSNTSVIMTIGQIFFFSGHDLILAINVWRRNKDYVGGAAY